MKNVLCILLLVLMQQTFSQDFSLTEIKLNDTILVSQIEKFIKDKKEESNLFKKRGYISLRYWYENKQSKKNELRAKFAIQDQYFIPNIDRSLCPSYYCYIEGKLILVYNSWLDIAEQPKYRKKLKRKLRKLLKPYFDKPKHLKARNNSGELVINDRNYVPESYNLHGGITLSIYFNGEFNVKKGVY